MNKNIKDVAVRAGKTFWQAAFGYIVASVGATLSGVEAFDGDAVINAIIGVVIGACAAGLSAAYNGAIVPVVNKMTGKALGGDVSVDEGE